MITETYQERQKYIDDTVKKIKWQRELQKERDAAEAAKNKKPKGGKKDDKKKKKK